MKTTSAQSAEALGKIIARARAQRGLSQAALASMLGSSQAWVSEVESGKPTAQLGKVLRALTALGVRLEAMTLASAEPVAGRKARRGARSRTSLDELLASHTAKS